MAEQTERQRKGAGFTDWLRVSAEATWKQALAHRFFNETAGDTIEDRVFARYLGIEYAFVDSAAVVLGHAAPGFAERRWLAIGVHGLVTNQQDYFVAAFERSGPASRSPLSSQQRELSAGLLVRTPTRLASTDGMIKKPSRGAGCGKAASPDL
jgi:thiaminase